MTQNTTNKHLWGKLCLAAAAICVSVSAYAAEPFPNDGHLKANTDYLIEGETELLATFIPEQSGVVTYTRGNSVTPYKNPSHTEDQEWERTFQSFVDQSYSISVEKDVPVYFYISQFAVKYEVGGQIFRINQDQPIEVVSYTAQPGSVLSVTDGYTDMGIVFNQPVTVGSATLSIDGTSDVANISMTTVPNVNVYVPYVNAIKNWMRTGAVKGGEHLTLTLKDIKNAAGKSYKDGEDLVLNYIAPELFVSLLSYETPDPFMSFWKKGNPEAVMTITYDGAISKA